MQDDNQKIRDESEMLRNKYEALRKFANANKIHIPQELEMI